MKKCLKLLPVLLLSALLLSGCGGNAAGSSASGPVQGTDTVVVAMDPNSEPASGFDPAFGTQFSTYAVPVILGEMRRLFRDGGAVKVSRTLKELSMRISRERERLANVLGRDPTVADLAQSMDLPEEQVVEALCAAAPPLSLTESDDDGGGQIDLPVASPEDMLSDVISLKQVVGSLEPNDRKLIVLRYFSGMTQVQTAARLGMTQVQVSRREKKILTALRRELTG